MIDLAKTEPMTLLNDKEHLITIELTKNVANYSIVDEFVPKAEEVKKWKLMKTSNVKKVKFLPALKD